MRNDDLDSIREQYRTMTPSDWGQWAAMLGISLAMIVWIIATAV